MEQEKIERILEEHLFLGGLEPEEIEIDGIMEAAAEIAKLVDQQLQSEHEEIRIRTKREVELQAQLAEMADVLADAGITLESIDPSASVIEKVDKAIERYMDTAPKVRWLEDAIARLGEDGFGNVWTALMVKGDTGLEHGQQVEVVVRDKEEGNETG